MAVTFTTELVRLKPDELTSSWTRVFARASGQSKTLDTVFDVRKEDDGKISVETTSSTDDRVLSMHVEASVANQETTSYGKMDGKTRVEFPLSEHVFRCGHLRMILSITFKEGKVDSYMEQCKEKCENENKLCRPPTSCQQCDPKEKPAPVPIHKVPLLKTFKNGPFLKDKLTDFEIHVKETVFHTQKAILWIEGKVFQRMVENDMRESLEGIVNVEDCEPEEMRMFLFVYYDRESMADYADDCGKVLSIFRLSHRYEVHDMIQRSANALMRIPIDPEFFCEAVLRASLCRESLPDLLKKCVRTTGDLPDDFWQWPSSEAFLRAHPKVVADFMQAVGQQNRALR